MNPAPSKFLNNSSSCTTLPSSSSSSFLPRPFHQFQAPALLLLLGCLLTTPPSPLLFPTLYLLGRLFDSRRQLFSVASPHQLLLLYTPNLAVHSAADTCFKWMMPHHQIKDHTTIKIIAIMAERDSAIQERNLALSEKKAALAERDLAFLQRDAAISDRNNAIAERDAAIAALHYAHEDANGHCGHAARGGCIKHTNHQQQEHSASHLNPLSQSSDGPYCNAGDMHITNAYPISSIPENGTKPRRGKHPRKEMVQSVPSKKPAKTSSRKSKRGGEDLNKQVTIAKSPWRGQEVFSNGDDLNKVVSTAEQEWRGLDLGLNQVTFDEATMAVPGCSCTGVLRQCYKWGNGGWQSSCCTTTMSMHPLPVIPNKRHARIGGRKMSGSAFTKLLSRLAREGHDLSMPVDLKDHWAKHGTNRYITIK